MAAAGHPVEAQAEVEEDIRVVAIPAAAVGEVIPTPGAEVEDPMENKEIPDRTLKTTPKCSP